jgi:hypothetical protein
MGNIFDRLKVSAFSVVTRTMGYAATWSPSEGGATKSANVLYMAPTELVKISGMEFNPHRWGIEFLKSDFEGIKQAVDDGLHEVIKVTIDEVETEFYVREINAIVDGDKYLAFAELKL